MSATRPSPELFPTRGSRWGVVVSGFGLTFGLVEFAHIRAMSSQVGIVLEAVIPLLGAVGLVVAGFALWTGQYGYDDVDVPRVVGWTVVGMLGMAVIFFWIFAHQLIRGGTFHHANFILTNNLITGGLIGFVIGTYDARSRSYQRSFRQERLKLEFLNRELRHHLLNGMSVILGQVERHELETDSELGDPMATIRERGEEIVDRINDVQTITGAFTDDGPTTLSEQDLSRTLRDVLDHADDRYERAEISANVPDGITVRADPLLPVVFENLLSNAIDHNDGDDPRVRVSLSVDEQHALVRIADNGPGIPDDQKDLLFTWEQPTGGRIGTGVGLAIVNVLVDRYDGRIWVEDDEPSGTVAFVELARAT